MAYRDYKVLTISKGQITPKSYDASSIKEAMAIVLDKTSENDSWSIKRWEYSRYNTVINQIYGWIAIDSSVYDILKNPS